MAKSDEKLKADISAKSDRELQEWVLFSTAQSEKHLQRLSNNVAFLVWLVIISLIFYVIGFAFGVKETIGH